MAYLEGVVFHLSMVIMHQIKPACIDYYHLKGFEDWFIYSQDMIGLEFLTNPETPCSIHL